MAELVSQWAKMNTRPQQMNVPKQIDKRHHKNKTSKQASHLDVVPVQSHLLHFLSLEQQIISKRLQSTADL